MEAIARELPLQALGEVKNAVKRLTPNTSTTAQPALHGLPHGTAEAPVFLSDSRFKPRERLKML